MSDQPESITTESLDTITGTKDDRRSPIVMLIMIIVIVAVVLIGLYVMLSLNTRSNIGSLDYIPYNKVKELVDKGYFVSVFIYNNKTNALATYTYTNEWTNILKRSKLIVALSVSSDSSGRYLTSAPTMYLVGLKGSNGLLDYITSSITDPDLVELKNKEPKERDGFRVWTSGRNIMISDTKGSIVILVDASRFESLDLDYIVDIAITFAKVLDKGNGWTCSDHDLNKLIASIPREYKNANVLLLKNSTDTTIIFTKAGSSLMEVISKHENYIIITKSLEKFIQNNMHYTVLESSGKYLLIRTIPLGTTTNRWDQQDVLSIQDAYLAVQHNTDGTITVYLEIALKNIGDKKVEVKEIIVAPDNTNLLTSTVIINPGTIWSQTILVGNFNGSDISIWESGTEHIVTVKYDIVGGSQNQMVSARVRAV